jgi:hypothetical protein
VVELGYMFHGNVKLTCKKQTFLDKKKVIIPRMGYKQWKTDLAIL